MTGIVGALAALLNRWWSRAQTRRELAKLDDRLLRDIGVIRPQMRREVSKRPWQD